MRDDAINRLRALLTYAERCDVPEWWLRETAEQLFDALLAADRRKIESFALARRVAHADAQLRAGHSYDRVRALMERFELGRARVYELLRTDQRQRTLRETALSSDSPDTDVMKSGS